MKCVKCQSIANRFPSFPEMFKELHAGWCMPCITEDNRERYHWLQYNGVFLKHRDLLGELDSRAITQQEFEIRKKQLYAI